MKLKIVKNLDDVDGGLVVLEDVDTAEVLALAPARIGSDEVLLPGGGVARLVGDDTRLSHFSRPVTVPKI